MCLSAVRRLVRVGVRPVRLRGLIPRPLRRLYRAMAWPGERGGDESDGRERTMKDSMKERLFAARRDLFPRLYFVSTGRCGLTDCYLQS